MSQALSAASPPSAPPTRAEQKDLRRRLLLEATIQDVARHGYHGASVVRIAKAAGVTTGAIYSQFADKAALVLSALAEMDSDVGLPHPVPGEGARSYLQRMAANVLDPAEHATEATRAGLHFQAALIMAYSEVPGLADLLAQQAHKAVVILGERIMEAAASDAELRMPADQLAFAFQGLLVAASSALVHEPPYLERTMVEGTLEAFLDLTIA